MFNLNGFINICYILSLHCDECGNNINLIGLYLWHCIFIAKSQISHNQNISIKCSIQLILSLYMNQTRKSLIIWSSITAGFTRNSNMFKLFMMIVTRFTSFTNASCCADLAFRWTCTSHLACWYFASACYNFQKCLGHMVNDL